MPGKASVELCDPDIVRKVAKVVGDQCAAHKAIEDYDQRRDAGEDVRIFQMGETLIVGPLP